MAQHNFNKTLKPFQVISQTVVLVGILIGTTLWLGACGDKATIDEKITVINNTGAEIKVVRCASTPKLWKLGAKPEGPDVARAECGPIPPGESDSITLKVWPGGFFTPWKRMSMMGVRQSFPGRTQRTWTQRCPLARLPQSR